MKLRLHANFMDLLPPETESIQALKELNSQAGGSSYLIAVIESSSAEAARLAAEKLAAQAGALPEIGYVNNRTDVPAFKDRKLLFLSLASIGKLHQDIRGILDYYRRQANPFYIDLLDEKAPTLDLDAYEAEEKVSRIGGFSARRAGQFMQVVLIKPLHPLSDFDRSEKLFRKLQLVFEGVKESPGTGPEDVSMALTGPYKVRYDEYLTITRDLKRTGLMAAVLIGLILIGGFRSFRSIVYICFSIVTALLWTCAFATLTIGYLNLISAFLFAILLGVGIDYAIHTRIALEQNQIQLGLARAAIARTYADVGKPVFTGCLTTSIAFFSLTISPFEGFRHFGIISGVGILLSFLAAFYVMPSFMVVTEKFFPVKRSGRSLPLRKVRMPRRFINTVLAASLLFSVYSFVQIRHIRFDYNFAHLQAKDEGIKLALRVYKHFGVELTPAALMTPDRARAVDVARQVNQYISEHPESTFDFAASILSHVPRDQAEKILILRQIETLIAGRERLLSKLDAETRKKIRNLRIQLQATELPWQELPEGMKRQYEGEDRKVSVVYIFPKESILDGQVAQQFVRELRALPLPEEIRLAGEPVIYADILRLLERDSPRALGLSLLVVILLLFLHFRRPEDVFWVLLPVLTAFLWMIGMAGAIGFKFNYLNVAILPSLLGAGIDNGIYIYSCYKEKRHGAFLRVFWNAGKGVTLSSLTTIAAFASLTLAHHEGMASVGLLGFLGFTSCFFTAVLVLPALIQWRQNLAARASRSKRGRRLQASRFLLRDSAMAGGRTAEKLIAAEEK